MTNLFMVVVLVSAAIYNVDRAPKACGWCLIGAGWYGLLWYGSWG